MDSRVRNLENRPTLITSPEPRQALPSATHSYWEATGTSSGIEQLPLFALEDRALDVEPDRSASPLVTSFHGSHAPWTALVNGTASNLGLEVLETFHDTAKRLSEAERSTVLPTGHLQYDLLGEFPTLDSEAIHDFVGNYSREAPFPILYSGTLKVLTERVISCGVSRWGEIVCVLLVC